MTDPIADMLTRIRNGGLARKESITVPFSRIKLAIAKILEKEGYVGLVEDQTIGDAGEKEIPGRRKAFKIHLLYDAKRRILLREIHRISSPGRRFYVGYKDLAQRERERGLAILSTPRGIMTSKEARAVRVGGELICEVS